MNTCALHRFGRFATMLWACLLLSAVSFGAENPAKMPSASQVTALAKNHFAQQKNYQKGDIISLAEVAPLLAKLEKQGWRGATKLPLLQMMLPSGHLLVRELRSTPGRKFMRKTASYQQIYDRLDRIGAMPGGARLIHDLVRLPDGQRYAQWKVHRGAPSMKEFLPKGRSGKSPRVKNLKQPTGRIYTEEQFLQELRQSRIAAEKN